MILAVLLAARGSGSETRGIESGNRYDRLVIRNVVVIDGKGTPPRGPVDVIVAGNEIQSVSYPVKTGRDAYKEESHVLDGTGMHLLPGLIDMHGHYSKADVVPFEYVHKLYLASGVTSLRDCGSDYDLTIEERRKSNEGSVAAPRIFLYMIASRGVKTPEEIRKNVREIKKAGGDGVKIYGLDRDLMEACLNEAKKQELRVAHHVGLEETDAWDCARFGVTTIEHWYGIPDAALHGSQNFPPQYNYNDENERFRYGGHLWREVDENKLEKVLRTLVDQGVAWVPTFSVYEANRDLLRARNKPWFRDYLHPGLEEFWKPNPEHHASYFWNWSTEDEVFWRENYRIWMKAVRDFANMGGTVCVGDDAGSLYGLFGFCLIRELELQREAGFHPIDVIQHATGANARVLGMGDKLGRVRAGFLADLILVDGNPLKNLKYLYPTGVTELQNGKIVTRGGVQWTIKDGIVYHAPTLLKDVKRIVDQAKKGM